MKKEIICTVCPRGCHIMVEGDGEKISSMEGYTCQRGKGYASTEFAHPVRILTTTVKVARAGGTLLPVRSSAPVPKEKLFDCMAVIRGTQVERPVKQYDVVVSNICGTGVDIVASGEISDT